MQTATGVDAPDLVQLTMLILQGELPQQSVTDLVTDLEGELSIVLCFHPSSIPLTYVLLSLPGEWRIVDSWDGLS